MRSYEFITENHKKRPEISLRHLNNLKHELRAHAASHARHHRLVRLMYASPAKEHERIEIEKAHLSWNSRR